MMTFTYDTHRLLIIPPTWPLPEHAAHSFGAFASSCERGIVLHGVAFGPAGAPVVQALAAGGVG